jgi:hypothetical protein
MPRTMPSSVGGARSPRSRASIRSARLARCYRDHLHVAQSQCPQLVAVVRWRQSGGPWLSLEPWPQNARVGYNGGMPPTAPPKRHWFQFSLRLPCLRRMVNEGSSFRGGRELQGQHARGLSTAPRQMQAGGDSAMIRIGWAAGRTRKLSEAERAARELSLLIRSRDFGLTGHAWPRRLLCRWSVASSQNRRSGSWLGRT